MLRSQNTNAVGGSIAQFTIAVKSLTDATFFIDENFVSGDIYAIASVDAHSLTSAYSSQLRCSFNKELKIDRIIPQGCPKAYPNLFYKTDPFPDVVFESGKSKCSVIFSPEHIAVSTDRNKSESVVVLETEGSYTLQIISLDALRAKNIKTPYRDWETDRKSTRLNSSHEIPSRMPSSA